MLVLPPLRERRDDLGLLVSARLRRLPRPERIRFDAAAVRTLIGHHWPLNVRERSAASRRRMW
jgi:DNA-binding NtrC family response regulator